MADQPRRKGLEVFRLIFTRDYQADSNTNF